MNMAMQIRTKHSSNTSSLADFWRECRVIYHRSMRDRASRRKDVGRWMHHRARLTLLERVRNPAMTKAFREAGFIV